MPLQYICILYLYNKISSIWLQIYFGHEKYEFPLEQRFDQAFFMIN